MKSEIVLAIQMIWETNKDKVSLSKHVKELVPDAPITYISAFLDGWISAKEEE